jgi:hypothetical protein
MRENAHTLSDFLVPTLSIECEPCARFGDAKLPELLYVLVAPGPNPRPRLPPLQRSRRHHGILRQRNDGMASVLFLHIEEGKERSRPTTNSLKPTIVSDRPDPWSRPYPRGRAGGGPSGAGLAWGPPSPRSRPCMTALSSFASAARSGSRRGARGNLSISMARRTAAVTAAYPVGMGNSAY